MPRRYSRPRLEREATGDPTMALAYEKAGTCRMIITSPKEGRYVRKRR